MLDVLRDCRFNLVEAKPYASLVRHAPAPFAQVPVLLLAAEHRLPVNRAAQARLNVPLPGRYRTPTRTGSKLLKLNRRTWDAFVGCAFGFACAIVSLLADRPVQNVVYSHGQRVFAVRTRISPPRLAFFFFFFPCLGGCGR